MVQVLNDTIVLSCLGGRPLGPNPQVVAGTVFLDHRSTFLATATLTTIFGNNLGGAWDYDNGVAAEVFAVDFGPLGPICWGLRLGPNGDDANLRPSTFTGTGVAITFWLRVWDPKEMMAVMSCSVLYDF
jgi:hypothetical protein